MARIWAEIISSGPIGPDDNFFDVGGTSMHLVEVHRRMVAELGATDLAMVELFEFPTPRRLAYRIGIAAAEVTVADTTVESARTRKRGLASRRASRQPASARVPDALD